jgi:hypothetical protein
MINGFEFKDDGRTYTCTVEVRNGPAPESWWWFAVSGDQQRYAPFRAAKGDTQASVTERVVQFYTNRLFQLTQPTVRGGHWNKRSAATPAAAPPAAPEAVQ